MHDLRVCDPVLFVAVSYHRRVEPVARCRHQEERQRSAFFCFESGYIFFCRNAVPARHRSLAQRRRSREPGRAGRPRTAAARREQTRLDRVTTGDTRRADSPGYMGARASHAAAAAPPSGEASRTPSARSGSGAGVLHARDSRDRGFGLSDRPGAVTGMRRRLRRRCLSRCPIG